MKGGILLLQNFYTLQKFQDSCVIITFNYLEAFYNFWDGLFDCIAYIYTHVYVNTYSILIEIGSIASKICFTAIRIDTVAYIQ